MSRSNRNALLVLVLSFLFLVAADPVLSALDTSVARSPIVGGADVVTGEGADVDGNRADVSGPQAAVLGGGDAVIGIGVRVVGTRGQVRGTWLRGHDRLILVRFGFDCAAVGEEARAELEELIRGLPPGSKVKVKGYTDALGPRGYNYGLSVRRARHVSAWLPRRPDLEFAEPRAYGQSHRVARNFGADRADNPPGRRKNRRVAIVVDLPAHAGAHPTQVRIVRADPVNRSCQDQAG